MSPYECLHEGDCPGCPEHDPDPLPADYDEWLARMEVRLSWEASR